MNPKRLSQKNFSNNSRVPVVGGVFFAFLVCFMILFTLAYFFADDFSTNYIGMSGKVLIEAVGKGTSSYQSIEDTDTANLEIILEDGYSVLIPGMEIEMAANVKVFRSTTKPLIRARFRIKLYEKVGSEYVERAIDDENLCGELEYQFNSIITSNEWYQYSDGYFYYIGDNSVSATPKDTTMQEVDATSGDTIVHFINEKVIFPTTITSAYSTFRVCVKINFQAIQNYIPDDDGLKVANTIANSQKIFYDFVDTEFGEVAPLSLFNITTVDGKLTIGLKDGVTLPANLVLPSVDSSGKPITAIDDSFRYNQDIKSLYIPASYTTMEPYAFANSSLQTVNMANSNITVLPNYAFNNCSSLTSVILPQGLVEIGNYALANIKITNINLPSTLETIGNNGISSTNIISLYIPANVTSIGVKAFTSNSSIKNVVVDDNNPNYKSDSDVALLTKDGKHFIYIASKAGIGDYAIPEGVESIGGQAFHICSFDNLHFPASLTTIDSEAFLAASNFLSFTVSEGNTSFSTTEDGVGLLSKDKSTFIKYANNSVNSVYSIPDSVTTIRRHSFDSIKYIQTLNIPASVISIGHAMSANKGALKNIYVDINNPAYKDVDGVLLLNKAGTILYLYTVNNTATTLVVPDEVTTIMTYSIYTFRYLEEIIIGPNIVNIQTGGIEASSGTTTLKILQISAIIPPTLTSSAFSSWDPSFKIYVPDGSVDAYKQAAGWSTFADRIFAVSTRP